MSLSFAIAPSHTLSQRFLEAMEQVQDKLLHLLASSPLLLLAILIVLAAVWLGGFISRRMRILTRISRSNPYMDGLLRNSVQVLIGLAGVLVALDLLNATSLVGAVLGSAGVVGLVLGFAFKDIAENYIAGVLLSLRQPFAPGDSVRIDSYEGKVIALNSRATYLMTAEGNHLQLPNSLVFKSVLLNFSRNPQRRFDFQIAVGNRASLHKAMDLGTATLAGIEGVLPQPAPAALILNLGNDGATLQFTGWIDQSRNDLSRTRSEAMRRLRRILWEAGIPAPEAVQRVVVVRNGSEQMPLPENGQARDTSVDRTLDAQLGRARALEDGDDLLETPSRPQLP
ncbi:MAG: mechanosensitive ion channel [Xanthomonadaceae bacterium]|nr:mechanosensitive ion channel [Xanthomonadaceae bacterium]